MKADDGSAEIGRRVLLNSYKRPTVLRLSLLLNDDNVVGVEQEQYGQALSFD